MLSGRLKIAFGAVNLLHVTVGFFNKLREFRVMYSRYLGEGGSGKNEDMLQNTIMLESHHAHPLANFRETVLHLARRSIRKRSKGSVFTLRRHRILNSYSITFPIQHSITVSTLATRLGHISKDLRLDISRQGDDYVRYTLSSTGDIGEALSSVLARGDSNCSIGSPPTSTARYRTVAYMQERAFLYEGWGEALQSALLTLKQEEALSIQISFGQLWRSGRFNGQDHMLMSVTLRFSGTPSRLNSLFPETTDRRKWKVRAIGRGRLHWNVRPVGGIDSIIPPYLLQMRESGGSVAERHYLHPTGNEITLQQMTFKNMDRTLQIGSSVMQKNIIVFGGTGTGKTSSLAILAKALIERKQSVVTIDPNGDLGPKILSLLSPDLLGSVLYIDSNRTPAGINPISVLQGDGLSGNWIDVVADAIAFSIRMTYGEKFYGPRMGYLLRLIIKGLAEVEGSNLYDAYKVLTDRVSYGQFRQTVQNHQVREALDAEEDSFFSDWGMPIRNKLGLALFNDTASRMLCKRRNNLDISLILNEGMSVLIDTDIASVGKEGPSLIGSFALAVFWLKAISLRRRLTIIIDEFQNYPIELINDIATQGRKYGVNIIMATQSPGVLSKEHLNSFGSNFPVKLVFRLGQMDAMLASEMTTGVDPREIAELPDLSCIFSSNDGATLLSVAEVLPDQESAKLAIEHSLRKISLENDVAPSLFFQDDAALFKMLQAVRTAETTGMKSISQLSDTGIFELAEIPRADKTALIKSGRRMGFIENSRLKLTNKGRTEMISLQGGLLAGHEEHRMIALRFKDTLETLGGYLACLPVQRSNVQQPDVIAVPVNGREGYRLHAEIEISTAYTRGNIGRKVEHAWANNAIPILVFTNRSTAKLFSKRFSSLALTILFDEDEAYIVKPDRVIKLNMQEELDSELYQVYLANQGV